LYAITTSETFSLGTIPSGILVTSTADLTVAKGQSVGTVTVTDAATATLSGGPHGESLVYQGTPQIVVTLLGDTFIVGVGSNQGHAQTLLAAISGDGGATGWSAVAAQFAFNGDEHNSVALGTSSVTDDTATITLPATAAYLLSVDETLSLGTIANSILVASAVDLTAAGGQCLGTVTITNEGTRELCICWELLFCVVLTGGGSGIQRRTPTDAQRRTNKYCIVLYCIVLYCF
jgi:hypothetical protein